MDLEEDRVDNTEKCRLPLAQIEGVPHLQVTFDMWGAIQSFQAREDDILIATYPKSGTTWTQEIVDLILQGGNVEKTLRAPTYVKVPFIDNVCLKPKKTGVEMANELKSPRIIKTHLRAELVPPSFWEKNVKVLYVARNAKDTMVSYFHFQRMNKRLPDPGSWDNYFSMFLSGEVSWGSWFDHVIGWWNAKDKHRILYMFYEDMIEDPKREIRRILNFLELDLSEEVLETIKDHTSFEAMKKNPLTNFTGLPPSLMDHTISPFMRKGTVGDWKNYFSEAQNIAFDEEYRKRMEGTGLTFRAEL